MLEAMLLGYMECALWSSLDWDDKDESDNPAHMDAKHTFEDFAPETIERMKKDCMAFLEGAGHLLETGEIEQAGHDFWLTRNRHGCGFWDGDWDTRGDKLTELSHAAGEIDLYVGDDGRIYIG